MEKLQADVTIVGYGPVGRMAAIALAEKGHKVIVVERQLATYPLPRAVCMDHEIYRAAKRHSFGGDIGSYCTPSPRYTWMGMNWETLLDIDWTVESISGGPEAYFFYQPKLEDAMALRVEDLGNVTVLYGHEAVHYSQNTSGISVSISKRSDGTPKVINSQYLIGADGANSVIRRQLGADWTELGFNADFLVVDVALNSGVELDIPAAGQYCNPERPTTFVPGGLIDGRPIRRWEFMCHAHEDRTTFDTADKVWPLLEKWVKPSQGELIRHATYTFRSLVAKKWADGRVFLAGDAAHLTPPFLGQGMCSGIRDAVNLAWRLDLVLRGVSGAKLLQAYEQERKPHITRMIEIAIYLGKIICVADPEAARERDRRYLAGEAPPPPALPYIEAGTLFAGTPAAGQLSPHTQVEFNGCLKELDEITGPNFTLVLRDATQVSTLTPSQLEILRALDVAIIGLSGRAVGVMTVNDVNGKFSKFMTDHQAVAYLARPDGCIYGSAASEADVSALVNSLTTTMALQSHAPSESALASL